MTKYVSLAKILIQDALKHQVAYYGVEGLEDAIKRVYKLMPKARDAILAEYYEMYKKTNKK